MDIRTTAPYLESCLSHLLAVGDLASWPFLKAHLQLRDSVGIAPTSLPRGTHDLIAPVATLSATSANYDATFVSSVNLP